MLFQNFIENGPKVCHTFFWCGTPMLGSTPLSTSVTHLFLVLRDVSIVLLYFPGFKYSR